MKLPVNALLLIFFLVPNSSSALVVNSDIAADTTWTVADSPVTVTDADFRILTGSTLTIDPGVTVNFASSVSVYGTLNAIGTALNRITFDELNPGDGWGGFSVTRSNCTGHNTSTLRYVDMNNLEGGITVDRQSLTIQNASIVLTSASAFPIQGYNNGATTCPGPTLEFVLTESLILASSSYTGGAMDDANLIYMDGVNSEITNNVLDMNFFGAPYEASVLTFTVSNTDDFTAVVQDNSILGTANDDGTEFLYGVNLDDPAVMADLSGNNVILTAHNAIYGLYLQSESATDNTITADSTSETSLSSNQAVYGIYSTSVADTTDIKDNKITLNTDKTRYLTGIFGQHGEIHNNRILLNHDGTSGSATGLRHDYYPGDFRNNSVLISGNANVIARGIFLGTRYNDASETGIYNNIFSAANQNASQGLYIDENYAGPVNHDYNLFYGFASAFFGTTAGTNELFEDPVFDNLSELTLDPASPALDKGDWDSGYSNEPVPNGGRIDLGAHGNTANATATVAIIAPQISTNNGSDASTEDSTLTLTGRTSSATQTLFVNNATTGVTYTPGETAWSFTTSLSVGANVFTVKARDGSGNDSLTDTITFTRVDETPPSVASTSPADGATDIALDTDISVTFTEELDGATVTAGSISLSPALSAEIGYADGTATLTPDSNLSADTTYTVTLTTDIKDVNGNALAAPYSWSFQTLSAPAPEGETPEDGDAPAGDDTEGEEELPENEEPGASLEAPASAGCSLNMRILP